MNALWFWEIKQPIGKLPNPNVLCRELNEIFDRLPPHEARFWRRIYITGPLLGVLLCH